MNAWRKKIATTDLSPGPVCWFSVYFLLISLLLFITRENLFLNHAAIRDIGILIIAILVFPLIMWRSIVNDRSANITQNLANIALQNQVINAYTRAIEQIGAHINGNPQLEIRVGGLYALEKIAKTNKEFHSQIMEILCTYVQINSPNLESTSNKKNDDQVKQDIQTALTIIGRRNNKFDDKTINLSNTNLRNYHLEDAYLKDADLMYTNLEGAHLERANLEGAHLILARLGGARLTRAHLEWSHLERANLNKAHMAGARLVGAHMEGTNLVEANLQRAHLEGANLERGELLKAHLDGAHLEGAHLEKAHLEGATLIKTHLEGAHLEGAHLEKANLKGAYLMGTNLESAHLDRVNLEETNMEGAYLSLAKMKETRNLTQAQINNAYYFEELGPPELPEGLKLPQAKNLEN